MNMNELPQIRARSTSRGSGRRSISLIERGRRRVREIETPQFAAVFRVPSGRRDTVVA
jgi:hypothetical protein